MIPQIIVLSLVLISLLANAHLHGKPKTGKNNFWTALVSQLISLFILYMGGFFDKWIN